MVEEVFLKDYEDTINHNVELSQHLNNAIFNFFLSLLNIILVFFLDEKLIILAHLVLAILCLITFRACSKRYINLRFKKFIKNQNGKN